MDIQEMLEIGKRCTEEENAPCTAVCPLHIDIRTLLKHIHEGNWDSAWQLYKKQAIFPELLSRICDAPCHGACVRSATGGGLELPLLERAVCDYAGNITPRRYAVVQKKASVAIVGAGLTGLTAAVLLAGSGYRVALHEKESQPGGLLWEADEALLPRNVLEAQLKLVTQIQNINLQCNCKIASLAECRTDAVILATGEWAEARRIVSQDGDWDRAEFWAYQAENGVFLAMADSCNDRFSPTAAISAGKKTAQRADWYIRGMTSEHSSETWQDGKRLKPDTGGLEPENAVIPTDGSRYTAEEARKEAGRCLRCHCLRCAKACELLRQGRAYPKKYISDVCQSLSLVEKFSESISKRQIYSCNICAQCQAVCPECVDMGNVYLEARRILYEKGSLPPAFHEFFLNDMLFSNGETALLLPGEKGNSYMFFPGCRLGAFLPKTLETAYRFINDRLHGQVALHLGCCGAPAYWAGREDLHSEAMASLRDKWNSLGKPEVILACPTCAKLLGQYAPEIKQKMLWDLLASIGLPPQALDLHGLELAVFDPCSASGNTELKFNVRALLQHNGAVIKPLNESGGCCGYGGLISNVNPSLLERIVQRRVGQSTAAYVTYCVNCRDTFLRRGKPTRHLLELLFPEKEDEPLPTLSRQRDNRRLLSTRLKGAAVSHDQQIPLLADSAVLEKLDRQLILLEQVRQVITHCELKGCAIWDEASATFTGKYKEGSVTYWVQYRRLGDQYQVVNAYMHHVELIDDRSV